MYSSYADAVQAMTQAGIAPADPLTVPLEEARAIQNRYFAFLAADPPPLPRIEDAQVEGPAGSIPLRIFYPAGPPSGAAQEQHDGKRPGAGWWAGGIESHARTARLIAIETGLGVCAVGYHCSPECKCPVQVEEALSALRWLRENSSGLNLRRDGFVLWGESAGASMILAAAQMLRDAGKILPSGLVLFYGNFAGPSPQSRPYSKWVWQQYLRDASQAADPRAVPLLGAYFVIFRAGVGLGVGGYIVNIALVQEFTPARTRGWASAIISISSPTGLLLSSACAAFLTPLLGWRGMFVVGALPAFFAIVILAFIPESPRWALKLGRTDLARRSAAWALEMPPESVDLEPVASISPVTTKFTDIFAYHRSVLTGLLINLGVVTGLYGLLLWSPTLLVMVQRISPEGASKVMIAISLSNILGRILFSYLSEKIGRRPSGAIYTFGGAALLAFSGWVARGDIGLTSFFWLFLLLTFFLFDGGFAVSGPYTTEIWPSRVRASGAGFGYGAGGIGKITGPLGLALLIGSTNYISPEATTAKIVPAFLYLAAWYVLAGLAYVFVGFETKGRSLEDIDRMLEGVPAADLVDISKSN